MDGNGPEEVPVQYDMIIPEFYMRHVIDLASIVGNHSVGREQYITEFEHCCPLPMPTPPTFEPLYV